MSACQLASYAYSTRYSQPGLARVRGANLCHVAAVRDRERVVAAVGRAMGVLHGVRTDVVRGDHDIEQGEGNATRSDRRGRVHQVVRAEVVRPEVRGEPFDVHRAESGIATDGVNVVGRVEALVEEGHVVGHQLHQ